ncbi:MAG: hypothetical protein HY553_08070, partial [Elusimicrobia bacterium]|nr:hypothetical protein [Elusimicrobiota bacterium]
MNRRCLAGFAALLLPSCVLAQSSLLSLRGADSRITERREVVVRDASSWARLWTQHRGDAAPPVDFRVQAVRAGFLGGGAFEMEGFTASPALAAPAAGAAPAPVPAPADPSVGRAVARASGRLQNVLGAAPADTLAAAFDGRAQQAPVPPDTARGRQRDDQGRERRPPQPQPEPRPPPP